MDQQYHFRDSPDGLLAWDVFRLFELSRALEPFDCPLHDIRELDEAYWYDLGGAHPTCRDVAAHAARIAAADLRFPIILDHEGRVMDGMHRVCRAVIDGRDSVSAVRLPAWVEPDHVGVAVSDLSYSRTSISGVGGCPTS